jgi:hypothetical protein
MGESVKDHMHSLKPLYLARLYTSADDRQWGLAMFFCEDYDCEYEELAIGEFQEA